MSEKPFPRFGTPVIIKPIIGKRTGWVLFLTVLLLIVASVAFAFSPEEEMDIHLRHAETYFWFAMAEKANPAALESALTQLNMAESIADKAVISPGLSLKVRREIASLRSDIESQAQTHRKSLYSMFPLVRLLSPSLFTSETATGTYDLVGDPEEAAVTSAGSKLALLVLQNWSQKAQLNVLITSAPENPALENKMLYIANASPKLNIHTYHQLSSVLNAQEIKSVQSTPLRKKISPAIKEKILYSFNINEFLLLNVQKQDQIDRDYMYRVDALIFQKGQNDPSHYFYSTGFCRDRRAQLVPVVLANVILLFTAILLYTILMRYQYSDRKPRIIYFMIPVMGFLFGRITPWIILPMIMKIAPGPDTLAILSFWWPCVAGLLLFLAPAIFCRLFLTRLSGIFPIPQENIKTSALFLSTSLGACAYLAIPLFLYLENSTTEILLPLVVGSCLSMYIVGRVFDSFHRLPFCYILTPVLLLLAMGALTMRAEPLPIWICAGAAVILHIFIRVQATVHDPQGILHHKKQTCALDDDSDHPLSMSELIQKTKNPPYIRFGYIPDLSAIIDPLKNKRIVHIEISGGAGVGKSATANEIIKDITGVLASDSVTIIKVTCSRLQQHLSGCESPMTPFAPFIEAFNPYGFADLLMPPNNLLEQFKDVVGGHISLLDSFFHSSATDHSGVHLNLQDRFDKIVAQIRNKASKKPLILFIEDEHWMDPSSSSLFHHLLETFKPGHESELVLLWTSRKEKPCHQSGNAICRIELSQVTQSQRETILKTSLKLMQDVAKELAEKLSLGHPLEGELPWLYRVVAYLAENDYIVPCGNEYGWSDKIKDYTSLPIPPALETAIENQILNVMEFRPVLEFAACLGMQFRASFLMDVMNIQRIELLRILDRIETLSGLIVDIRDTDDLFSFRSSFVLDTIRKTFHITFQGLKAKDVPQLIREYHFQIAETMRNHTHNKTCSAYDVARHLYAAGAAHSESCFRYCLLASLNAQQDGHFDQAYQYLDMASDCAEAASIPFDRLRERFIIECYQSHVRQTNQKEIADKSWEWCNATTDTPLCLMITAMRACYDYAKNNQENKALAELYADRTLAIGEKILNGTDSALYQAEARHFIELSLIQKNSPKNDRLENLREATRLLEPILSDENKDAMGLYARIANTLGSLLTYDPQRDSQEAERLLLKSCSIKEEINDRNGLAMSYGALGRLFQENGRILRADGCEKEALDSFRRAKHYFLEDLNIAESMNDSISQAKMHSSIGACELAENNWENAIECYRRSSSMATLIKDRLFALTGLLKGLARVNASEPFNNAGRELLELIRINTPLLTAMDSRHSIQEVLSLDTPMPLGPWHEEIKELLKA